MSIQTICKAVFLTLTLFVCACTSVPKKALKPTVELISVMPLNISLSEQKLRFNLNIINPNSFALPVESVDFVARFNDNDIASGKNQQSTIIPANGAANLTLDVTAGIDRLASTFKTLLQGEQLNLSYELSGSVSIEDWAIPIPFNIAGAVSLEEALKG